MPFEAGDLPGPLRALAELQLAYVRERHFESDMELLASELEAIAREQPVISPEPVRERGEEGHPELDPAGAAHLEDVLRQMMDEGSLVPFLGPRMAAERSGAVEGTSSLPDAEALAAALAERFGVALARLPQIAQYVYTTRGSPDLYRMLSRLLTADYDPGPVHRSWPAFPGPSKAGHQKRYQLIVPTNFDTALEKAFDDEQEPYDLASLHGERFRDKGKFVHFPSEGLHATIHEPNKYTSFRSGSTTS